MAPRSSRTPVADTRSAGTGRLAGTIRISSGRVLGWKCEKAVNRNIAANAMRSAPVHETAWSHTPVAPITRATSHAASMTSNGAMSAPLLESEAQSEANHRGSGHALMPRGKPRPVEQSISRTADHCRQRRIEHESQRWHSSPSTANCAEHRVATRLDELRQERDEKHRNLGIEHAPDGCVHNQSRTSRVLDVWH